MDPVGPDKSLDDAALPRGTCSRAAGTVTIWDVCDACGLFPDAYCARATGKNTGWCAVQWSAACK